MEIPNETGQLGDGEQKEFFTARLAKYNRRKRNSSGGLSITLNIEILTKRWLENISRQEQQTSSNSQSESNNNQIEENQDLFDIVG